MNCPRCNNPCTHNNISATEYIISCDLCGFYSCKVITHFFDAEPIYEHKNLLPLGVVYTPEGNVQYFSKYQLKKFLKDRNVKGYSFYRNGKWIKTIFDYKFV